MVFAIQQKAWRREFMQLKQDTVDSRYWKDAGWLDRGSTYFFPHRAPWTRVLAARLTASAVGIFVR